MADAWTIPRATKSVNWGSSHETDSQRAGFLRGGSARALGEAWDAFWFTPADPTLLGLIRVLTGLMLLYTHAVWGLVLPSSSARRWLSQGLVRTLSDGNYTYSFWWLVPDGWMWPAYAALDGRAGAVHARAVDAGHVRPGVPGHGLVRLPRAGGDVRPRPDQRDAGVVPGDRAQRAGASIDRWLAVRRGRAQAARAGAELPARTWRCG